MGSFIFILKSLLLKRMRRMLSVKTHGLSFSWLIPSEYQQEY